jgi:AcrR family transcriptional regulator
MSNAAEKPTKAWTRRKQARPGEILEAALTVFAEKGFAAARMEDIAARAGVTKGTIYLYFPSKEEVFKSLARLHVGDTLAQAAELAAQYSGTVRDFLSMMLGIMAQKIEAGQFAVLPKIIIAEAGNFPELAQFWRDEVINKAFSMASGVIARGIANGEIRDVPPEYVVRTCMSAMLMCLIWRTVFAQFDNQPFEYAKFLEFHLDVVMRGLAPEGSKP